ncbi:hypothetical protein EMIHUDRAFT_201370 [Emiliania huxleyi CCMP1516]|uniref:Uncharacterized protein n=2 Tax=Emiliania huxleyi TaxID=2903 RepID=A0A0D3KHV7_EMIH1|nr:hypothetical protein EMIHUDRAFT_201370 [Emiliania huxleyi CCMP1516]EOD35342.1 hypothetical protein EMIHUDRAFT_201370 [Emiliania huxleyi CCMP1516]|eukprot:XP_005787771.1 hypothetical protein EMIHUDRAFT_201370 [Emiliania huxleyi CCMP1516]
MATARGKLLDAVAAAPSADEVFDFVSLHARIHDLQADLKTVDEACRAAGGSSSPGLIAARGARIVSAAVAEAEAALEAWRPGGKGVTTGAVASSASPPAPTGLDRLFRKILCGADVDALAESILRDNDALLDNWKLVVQ